MKYRLTVIPALEKALTGKVFEYETEEELEAAANGIAIILLFLPEIGAMSDYSNSFVKEYLIDGEWELLEEVE